MKNLSLLALLGLLIVSTVWCSEGELDEVDEDDGFLGPNCQDYSYKCDEEQLWFNSRENSCEKSKNVRQRCPRLCGLCTDADNKGDDTRAPIEDEITSEELEAYYASLSDKTIIPIALASASSTDSIEYFMPDNMIDGNLETFLSGGSEKSCFYSGKDSGDWAHLTFEEESTVTSVHLLNRGDCCGERVVGVQVYVCSGDDDCTLAGTIEENNAAAGNWSKIAVPKGIKGTYVKIQAGQNRLQVCEVEVHGKPTGSGYRFVPVRMVGAKDRYGADYEANNVNDLHAIPQWASTGACYLSNSLGPTNYITMSLQEESNVDMIKLLTGEHDTMSDLDGSRVSVCDTQGRCVDCGTFTSSDSASWASMKCSGARGYIVRIEASPKFPSARMIICEVEVHGRRIKDAPEFVERRIWSGRYRGSWDLGLMYDEQNYAYPGSAWQCHSRQVAGWLGMHLQKRAHVKVVSIIRTHYTHAVFIADGTDIQVCDDTDECVSCGLVNGGTELNKWYTHQCDATGTWIKIVHKYWFIVAEMQVYGLIAEDAPEFATIVAGSASRNWADHPDWDVWNMFDGVASGGGNADKSCYHSHSSIPRCAWAQVHLDRKYKIHSVSSLHRDMHQHSWLGTEYYACDEMQQCELCGKVTDDYNLGDWTTLPCNGKIATSIRFQAPCEGTHWHQICEAFVYGTPVDEGSGKDNLPFIGATGTGDYNVHYTQPMAINHAGSDFYTHVNHLNYISNMDKNGELHLSFEDTVHVDAVSFLLRSGTYQSGSKTLAGRTEGTTVSVCNEDECKECGKVQKLKSERGDWMDIDWFSMKCDLDGDMVKFLAASSPDHWLQLGEVIAYGSISTNTTKESEEAA